MPFRENNEFLSWKTCKNKGGPAYEILQFQHNVDKLFTQQWNFTLYKNVPAIIFII